MTSFLKLSDVKVQNANPAYRVPDTPETRALGRIPGKALWIDAAHADLAAGLVQNRARPNRFCEMPFVGTTGVLPGGIAALSATDADPMVIRPDEAINPDEWSAVFVIRPIADESRQVLINARADTLDTPPHIGLSSSGNTLYVYDTGTYGLGQPQRIEYLGNFPARAGPSLIVVTFSIAEGLHIYDGRTLVASAPDDTDPLVSAYGAGQWEMMRYYRGLMGMAALFNIDFHSPRHAPHREALQDWLIPAYGVTLP